MAATLADSLSQVSPSFRSQVRGNDYSPPASEADLVSSVIALFDEARKVKEPVAKQWRRNYNALRNRRRDIARRPDARTPDLPEIYPVCASYVGWLNKRNPQFQVSASAPALSQASNFWNKIGDDLQAVLHANWVNHDFRRQLKMADWDMVTYGTAIVASLWDNSLVGGLGNAVLRRVDPFTFYPDPKATSMEDANYFIEYREYSLQDIDRRFRGWFEKLNPNGAEMMDVIRAPRRTDVGAASVPFANPSAISPNTNNAYFPPRSPNATAGRPIPVLEAWLRQHTWEKVERPDPEDPSKTVSHYEVHDGWRYVVVAQNRVLVDTPVVELWNHGQPPFSRYVPEDHGEFWGESLVEMLTSAQLAINDLLEGMHRNIDLISNPIMVAGDSSGVKRAQLTNRPGNRLVKREGSEIGWLVPPEVQPQLATGLLQFYKGELESISGLSAMVQGFAPDGRNSQGVLNSVQDAALIRINNITQNREAMMTELGRKMAALICEFYDTPRTVSILGDDGTKTSLTLKSLHFYEPSPDGRVPMNFAILVEAGSSLPTSYDALANMATTLHALGAIDDEALLEVLRFPNRNNVVARVREMKAAGMMSQPGTRARGRA